MTEFNQNHIDGDILKYLKENNNQRLLSVQPYIGSSGIYFLIEQAIKSLQPIQIRFDKAQEKEMHALSSMDSISQLQMVNDSDQDNYNEHDDTKMAVDAGVQSQKHQQTQQFLVST